MPKTLEQLAAPAAEDVEIAPKRLSSSLPLLPRKT
jgi:hypothetical protein